MSARHPSAPDGSAARNLWIVIPAYNEESWIEATLDSVAEQVDADFSAVVVDNSSTDGTRAVVSRWREAHPQVDLRIITEQRKGTGAAADTGFRHAIDNGADWIARTDADCLLAPDWVASVRRNSQRAHLLGGRTRVRRDDITPRFGERLYLPITISAARWFGKLRPSNRSREYLCPYVMCVGNNLAIDASVYERSGGFRRLAFEELPYPGDRLLVNRVRKVTRFVRYAPDMVVYNSARRMRRYGLLRTLRWYASHSLDRERFEIDVR